MDIKLQPNGSVRVVKVKPELRHDSFLPSFLPLIPFSPFLPLIPFFPSFL
jgi:hypothetical protein